MNTMDHRVRTLSGTVAVIAVLICLTGPSFAASCPVADTVRNAGSALMVAARQSSAPAFDSVLARYADVNAIALFALGQYRGALPPAQRAEYVKNTERYITRFLVENSGAFKNSQNLTIDSCDGGLAGTSLNGQSRMLWRLSGGRIRDVQVSGVWLGLELRSKFTEILRRNGGNVDALLSFLRG